MFYPPLEQVALFCVDMEPFFARRKLSLPRSEVLSGCSCEFRNLVMCRSAKSKTHQKKKKGILIRRTMDLLEELVRQVISFCFVLRKLRNRVSVRSWTSSYRRSARNVLLRYHEEKKKERILFNFFLFQVSFVLAIPIPADQKREAVER